jgi:hypothetical protein
LYLVLDLGSRTIWWPRVNVTSQQRAYSRKAGLFLEGLLGDEQRKTGWMRAEAAGDPRPWRQQAILGRRDWDADALRDILRDYVIEHLDDAVLVIDETGFLKQGQGVVQRGAATYRFGRQDYELPDRGVRDPTFRVMAMRSLIARCIFRRNRTTIQIVWKPRTFLPIQTLRPNQSLRRE